MTKADAGPALTPETLRAAFQQVAAAPRAPRPTVHHPHCAIFDRARERGYVEPRDCTCGGSLFQ